MRVIAIDPGYDRCGVAIIERQKNREHVVFSTCIETNKKDVFEKRLLEVGLRIEKIIEEHKPQHMALESLYFTNNQKTAMHVAEVRGAIQYIAGLHNLPIHEYTPNQVKLAVTGSGRADKKQMISMINRLVIVKKNIAHDDEYDAIGVGITCLAHLRG